MDDEINGFINGVIITLFIFLILWIFTFNPVKMTVDGKYYLSTHGDYYQLVSDKPINIGTQIRGESK